jgi:hypothetical protein
VYAWPQQRVDIANLGIAATTNVVFDILLIPDYGALGCALSTLTAELVFLFACSRSVLSSAKEFTSQEGAVILSLHACY